jgi:hypothetical protein
MCSKPVSRESLADTEFGEDFAQKRFGIDSTSHTRQLN